MLKAKNTLANSKMLTTAKKFLPKLNSRGYHCVHQSQILPQRRSQDHPWRSSAQTPVIMATKITFRLL